MKNINFYRPLKAPPIGRSGEKICHHLAKMAGTSHFDKSRGMWGAEGGPVPHIPISGPMKRCTFIFWHGLKITANMLYQSHSAERLTRLAIVECCPLNSHSSPLEVARCDWTRCRRWSWTTSSSSCRSFSRLPLRLRCIPHVGSPRHYNDIE